MRRLFDENLSFRLARALADAYPGSEHVRDVGLRGAEDAQVWEHAAREGFVIVSKDADFFQRSAVCGAPPKVVWLRVGNGPTAVIEQLLRDRREVVAAFVDDPEAAFLALGSE